MTVQAERYSWIANELNKAAYSLQMAGRKTPLKHFHPCAKAVLFTAAISTKRPFYDLLNEAALTPCNCHSDWSAAEIEKLYDLAISLFPQAQSLTDDR